MPIKINGDAASVAKISKQIYSAKFFSKDITGSGKTTGMLNQSLYPANLAPNIPENTNASLHWHIFNETTTTHKSATYPLSPLGNYIPRAIKGAIPYDDTWCKMISNPSLHFALKPVTITTPFFFKPTVWPAPAAIATISLQFATSH